MRRGLVHAGAWSLATGAAVTLSWWGVHTVMAGTAYDPPRALPLATGDRAGDPQSSSTHRPGPPPDAAPSKNREDGTASESPPSEAPPAKTPKGAERNRKPLPATGSPKPTRSPGPTHTPASGSVRGYSTDGGRVVFDLGASPATLVSASPSAGWSMQVWKAPSWIRVEFTSGADRVSVFCTWHDHAPRIDVTTY
ncbi:hypothetical protein GPA10_07735 [Streptomyces sp. p1417]|uniref:Secreted protein n=1 Tax=Streptomyces typhae TaxID=2681492 RepID=A0A6L6WWN9_9ACTN|nr:hypothetical protein [Streptomyces typhae]MVO84661.1 hypothetical protein [Streptomyces typhae]